MNSPESDRAEPSKPRTAPGSSRVRPITIPHDDPDLAKLESEVAALGMLEAALKVAIATCGRAAVLRFVVART